MFSGIGGFREGLTRAGGFECVGHCEIDKYANRSYNALFDTKGEWFIEDARKADPGTMRLNTLRWHKETGVQGYHAITFKKQRPFLGKVRNGAAPSPHAVPAARSSARRTKLPDGDGDDSRRRSPRGR